ncbi:25038_t:CDS:2, partial [Gigaspora margarita]
ILDVRLRVLVQILLGTIMLAQWCNTIVKDGFLLLTSLNCMQPVGREYRFPIV